MSDDRQELERIWKEGPVAFPSHVAGWLTPTEALRLQRGWYQTKFKFCKVRGKKVQWLNRITVRLRYPFRWMRKA